MFGCELNWHDMKLVDEAREEVNEQLDVCLVVKKLLHLEKVVQFLTSEREYVTLQLTKPLTIKETRKMRKVLQYYGKVMENAFAGKESEEIHSILSLVSKRNLLPVEEVREK